MAIVTVRSGEKFVPMIAMTWLVALCVADEGVRASMCGVALDPLPDACATNVNGSDVSPVGSRT